jgi:hypothetical protein
LSGRVFLAAKTSPTSTTSIPARAHVSFMSDNLGSILPGERENQPEPLGNTGMHAIVSSSFTG